MKRFFSVLLVAILVVTSLSVVAFAAEQPGTTVTIPVTISGEFCNYLVSISVDEPLQIKEFSGTGTYVISGNSIRANYAGTVNIPSYTLNVTVYIPEDIKPGTYYISGSVERASHVVEPENDTDGIADNLMAATDVTVVGGQIVIEEPAHDHVMGDWEVTTPATCHSDGVETRKCTVEGCDYKETRAITDRPDHAWSTEWSMDGTQHWHVCTNEGCTEKTNVENHNLVWDYDDNNHWKVCTDCGYMTTKAAHNHNIKSGGYWYCECGHKGAAVAVDPDNDEVVDMGDITPYGTYNAIVLVTALIAVVSVYALVSKRKSVK